MINIVSVNIDAKISGMYKFVIERPDGSIKESGWIDNLILNSGLDLLGSSSANIDVLQQLTVGTGTIPTDPTQTALQSPVGNAYRDSFSTINKGAPLYESEVAHSYVFQQGAVVGNITEVGVSYDANVNTKLFSRSLITDEKGVPTALTVVALDKLTVYYKVTVYPTVADSSGSFVINNVTYNYVSRPSTIQNLCNNGLSPFYFSRLQNVTAYNETCTGLASIDGQPNGYMSNTYSVTNDVYSPGTYTTKASASFAATEGSSPIKAVVCTFAIPTQFLFTPSIPKSNTNQLVLRFTFSWGRG